MLLLMERYTPNGLVYVSGTSRRDGKTEYTGQLITVWGQESEGLVCQIQTPFGGRFLVVVTWVDLDSWIGMLDQIQASGVPWPVKMPASDAAHELLKLRELRRVPRV